MPIQCLRFLVIGRLQNQLKFCILLWPTGKHVIHVHAGTKFPIYKVWWLREAWHIGQTFIPLSEKVQHCNLTSFHCQTKLKLKCRRARRPGNRRRYFFVGTSLLWTYEEWRVRAWIWLRKLERIKYKLVTRRQYYIKSLRNFKNCFLFHRFYYVLIDLNICRSLLLCLHCEPGCHSYLLFPPRKWSEWRLIEPKHSDLFTIHMQWSTWHMNTIQLTTFASWKCTL